MTLQRQPISRTKSVEAAPAAGQCPASGEAGSILILVAVSMVVLIGMVGLALDVGQLYVAQQQAQAAADAAALTGVVDLNTQGTTHVTAASYGRTYATMNAPNSTSTVRFYSCSAEAWCSGHMLTQNSLTSPNRDDIAEAVVTTTVNLTFLRVLPGINPSTTVTATADAALALGPGRFPMMALNPSLSGALTLNAGATLTICGGPSSALKVVSNSSSSINNGGTINLSQAGPNDPGNCSGTGAGLSNGGSQASVPGVLFGSSGSYQANASFGSTPDPLVYVTPQQPNGAGSTLIFNGNNGYYTCPAGLSCTVYLPGTYPSGIATSGISVFVPGVYWITQGGFTVSAGSIVRMATGGQTDPVTGQGMLIYNQSQSAGDIFNIQTGSGIIGGNTYPSGDCPNGGNCLTGSPPSSIYEGVLFYQNPTAGFSQTHLVDLSQTTLAGSFHITQTGSSSTTYQTLNLTGPGACSTTGFGSVAGQIIADAITVVSGCINVDLGQQLYLVPGLALVN